MPTKTSSKKSLFAALLGTLLLTSQPSTATNTIRKPFDLRDAIAKARIYRTGKQVVLNRGIYRLAAGTKRIVVSDNLVIIGQGSESESPNATTIDGMLIDDMIFEVLPTGHLTLVNLAVKNGRYDLHIHHHVKAAEPAGAIYNAGNLSLVHCTLYWNQTRISQLPNGTIVSGNGGAIYNTGVLHAKDSQLWGNACGNALRGGSGGGGAGGSIYNVGTAFFKNCVVESSLTDNGAFGGTPNGGDGGGIYNAGYMQIEDSLVDGNRSGVGANAALGGHGNQLFLANAGHGGNGGGIYNGGRMIIRRSTIVDNTCGDGGVGMGDAEAIPGGEGGYGSGVFNVGSLVIDRSRVVWNVGSSGGDGGEGQQLGGNGGAAGCGAGVYNGGYFVMSLCMVANNAAGHGGQGGAALNPPALRPSDPFPTEPARGGPGGNGGGLCNSGDATILSDTFTQNSAGAAGYAAGWLGFPINDGPPGDGGGIFTFTNALTSISSTIVAQNFVSNGIVRPTPPMAYDAQGPDYQGHMVSSGFNLIGIDDTRLMTAIGGDLVGSSYAPIDPMLTLDRGPTGLDYTPLPGSPAIDNGSSYGFNTDELGQPRVIDDPATPNAAGGDGADIGACEFDPNWVPPWEQ